MVRSFSLFKLLSRQKKKVIQNDWIDKFQIQKLIIHRFLGMLLLCKNEFEKIRR